MLFEVDREIITALADRKDNGLWIVYNKEINIGYIMMFATNENRFTFMVLESLEDIDKLIRGLEKLKEKMEANE